MTETAKHTPTDVAQAWALCAELDDAEQARDELLAALKGLVREHIKRGGAFDEPLGESEQTPEINAALAAIAKAEGRQP